MANKGSLKDRFSSYGAAPKAGAWDSIAGALPQKKNKAAVWWWISGGIAAAASIILFVSVYNGDINSGAEIMAETKEGQTEIKETTQIDKSAGHKDMDSNLMSEAIDSGKKEEIYLDNDDIKKPVVADVNPVIKTQPNSSILDARKSPTNAQITKANTEVKQKSKARNLTDQSPEIAFSTAKTTVLKAFNDSVLIVKNEFNDGNINLMSPQLTKKIQRAFNPLQLKSMEIAQQHNRNWLVGVKINADLGFGANTNDATSFNTQSTEDFAVLAQESIEDPINSTFPVNIDRPFGIALLLRYEAGARFFMEIEPSLQWYRIQNTFSAQNAIASISPSAQTYLSMGGGFSFGFKVIKKKRWIVDLAAGLNADRIMFKSEEINTENNTSSALLATSSRVSIGVNYHLSDKTFLRLAPTFSFPVRLSESAEAFALNYQKYAGLSLSMLRSF